MAILDEEFLKIARLFGGEEGATVIKVLKKLREATDEGIANDSAIRLNTIRKILYKLYDRGLVACTRIRDEKTGWYIFYWKLQPEQLDAFIRSRKRRILERLKQRLDYERSHNFFVCKKCENVRVTFEEAMESAFRCLNCTSQLMSIENLTIVEALDRKIKEIEGELVS